MTRYDEAQDETLLRRPTASLPYVPSGAILRVSGQALLLTNSVFELYAEHKVEAACFWYGTVDGTTATVRAVVVPAQRNSWGFYTISPDAIPPVANATRPRGWKNLAQVHTHPGTWVEHSRYDDEHANSRRALSLVYPLYGRWNGQWPVGIGVHEFQIDYWHFLSDEHAARRVVLCDDPAVLVDTRR